MAARENLGHRVLVGVGERRFGECLVVESQTGRHHLEPGAGPFRSDADGDALIGLDADHDQRRDAALPVPTDPQLRGIAELDHDLGDPAVQSLAGAHEDRDAVPAPVLDREPCCCVRFASGVVRYRFLIQVSDVLPSNRQRRDDGRHGAQRRALRPPHVLGIECCGRFHRDQGEQLQHVVLDHVADGAGLVVIARAQADPILLGGRDLDRLDQVPVPHRFEQRVREPECEHVLDRVLGQVVVDAEDLPFLERRRQLGVQGPRRFQVMTQRLLDHDPSCRVASRRQPGLGERPDDVAKSLGGCGQVEDHIPAARDQLLQTGERGL